MAVHSSKDKKDDDNKFSFKTWLKDLSKPANLLLFLTILCVLYFILNNIRFRGVTSGYLKFFGSVFLILSWLVFIGLMVTFGISFSKEESKDEKVDRSQRLATFVINLVIGLTVLGFVLFFIPQYLANAGVVWKGSKRVWIPWSDPGKNDSGYELKNILNDSWNKEGGTGYDQSGLYWGKKDGGFIQKLKKFFYTLPLVLVNFITGLPPFSFLNPFFISSFFGDGSKSGDEWTGDQKAGANTSQGGVMKLLYYIIIFFKAILSLINQFGGIIGKYLNPIDWDLLKTLNENSKGTDLAYMMNACANRPENEGKVDVSGLFKGGLFTFWFYIAMMISIGQIFFKPLIFPINISGVSFKAYLAFAGVLISLVLLSFFNIIKSKNSCQKGALQFMNLPCSNVFDDGLSKLSTNLNEYASKWYCPGDIFTLTKKDAYDQAMESENPDEKLAMKIANQACSAQIADTQMKGNAQEPVVAQTQPTIAKLEQTQESPTTEGEQS